MANQSPEGGPGDSLPQLPQDLTRISKYIQGVVQHNTLESGGRWPPQATVDQINGSGSGSNQMHHPPTPSPGGVVQPSPKDSGVDMNSPTHREENIHVDNDHEDQGKECTSRRDSTTVDCVAFGPSSVESGAVMEGPDLDPGGVNGMDHLSLELPSHSVNVTESFNSSQASDLQPSTSSQTLHQNIFEKFLMDKNCANSVSLAELNSGSGSSRQPSGLLHTDTSALGLTGLADPQRDLSISGSNSHSTEDSSSGSNNPYIYTPTKDLQQLSSSRLKGTPPSSSKAPGSKFSTPSRGLYTRSKSSESLTGLSTRVGEDDPFHIDLLENYQESDDDDEWKMKLERSLAGQFEPESSDEDDDDDIESDEPPPILVPVKPVHSRATTPTRSAQSSSSQNTAFQGTLSPTGFISEFAKFLTQSNKPEPPKARQQQQYQHRKIPVQSSNSQLSPILKRNSTTSVKNGAGKKRRSQSPRGRKSFSAANNVHHGKQAFKRKRHSSFSGSTVCSQKKDADNLLPVLKLRKLGAGNYAPVQSGKVEPKPPTPSASPKPPRLKIKYGSPEFGGLQVVDVHGQQPASEEEAEDEYVLREEVEEDQRDYGEMHRLESEGEMHERLSYRTISPPVLHREPASFEDFRHRQHKQLEQPKSKDVKDSSCGPCVKAQEKLVTETPPFCLRTHLNWHAKVVKLRRKALRLCRMLFPSVSFPHKFSKEGPQVDAFLDQVISAINEPGDSPPSTAGKPCGIPLGDPCCWQVNIVMCKSPKSCLNHLRVKVSYLLEALLPELKLGASFNRQDDVVDELLHHVFAANRPRLKDKPAMKTTPGPHSTVTS